MERRTREWRLMVGSACSTYSTGLTLAEHWTSHVEKNSKEKVQLILRKSEFYLKSKNIYVHPSRVPIYRRGKDEQIQGRKFKKSEWYHMTKSKNKVEEEYSQIVIRVNFIASTIASVS